MSADILGEIPILGPVRIAEITGAFRLKGNSTSKRIDTKLANGTVTLNLEGKTLYITFQLNIKFVGIISLTKYKLLTLP